MNETTANDVFAAMTAVQADLARIGVAKKGTNAQQGFAFRKWDDVQQALAPILAAHKLLIIPHILTRTESTVQTKSGSQMFRVTLQGHLEFVSGLDGSCYNFPAVGEASDTGDKATSKAMTMLVKYAVLHALCVPLEGVSDADAETPPESVQARITAEQAANLQALAEEVGADIPRFLKYLKVPSLEEIAAQAYPDAVAALEMKRRQS